MNQKKVENHCSRVYRLEITGCLNSCPLCINYCSKTQQIVPNCSSQNLLSEECLKIGADFANVNNDAERIALWNMISNLNLFISDSVCFT